MDACNYADIYEALGLFAVECCNRDVFFEWRSDANCEKDSVTYMFTFKNKFVTMVRSYIIHKKYMHDISFQLMLRDYLDDFFREYEKFRKEVENA